MEGLSGVLTIVGAIASLVALFLPAKGWRQKLVHVIYGVAITISTETTIGYYQKYSQMNQIEYSANELIKTRRFLFSDQGFIHAALAFLEKNKDLYPDSYSRAKEMCERCGCLAGYHGPEGLILLGRKADIDAAASALEGLLRGIAQMSKGP